MASTTPGPGVCTPLSLSSGCSVMFMSPARITGAPAQCAPTFLPPSVFETCRAMAASIPSCTSSRKRFWSASVCGKCMTRK